MINLTLTNERNGIFEDQSGFRYTQISVEEQDAEICAGCGKEAIDGYLCSESREFFCEECAGTNHAETMWMYCWDKYISVKMEYTSQGWKCQCRCKNCENPHQYLEDAVYINVYAVTRHFGGPEEGGWWYNAGDPIGSVLAQVEEIEKVKTEMERRYREMEEGDIYSVRGGTKIEVHLEREFAKHWPERRPHYE